MESVYIHAFIISFHFNLQQRSPSPVSVGTFLAAYSQLSISRYLYDIQCGKYYALNYCEKSSFHFYWMLVVVSHFCLPFFAFMFSPCCHWMLFAALQLCFVKKNIPHYSEQSHRTNIKQVTYLLCTSHCIVYKNIPKLFIIRQ